MIGTFYAVGKLSYSPCHGQADRSRDQHSSGCVVPAYSPCRGGWIFPISHGGAEAAPWSFPTRNKLPPVPHHLCSASHSAPCSVRPMTFTDCLSPSTLLSLRWQKDTLHRPASNQPAQGGVCGASKKQAGAGTDRYTPMGSSHLFQSSLQAPQCPQLL